ncbi:MAG: sigma-70 family RNA polymerase sigma factor [Chitinophagaceae bacterium]
MQPDTYALHNTPFPHLATISDTGEKELKALYQSEFYKTEQYVLKNSGTAEQAKDTYQEAFIAVWRNLQLGRFTPKNETALAGYLYQVAKNKWIDYLRSGYHKNTVNTSEMVKEDELVEALPEAQSDFLDQVKKGFNELGDNCKEVLVRFYYKNETMKAIAAAMNWTEATARNNKYRCLEKLRAFVKK